MKKATLILISFISVFLGAQTQTIFKDDKGVIVFCEIQQTNKTTSCEDGTNSTKKINIWKVTLGLENGCSESIVPRGVGIADISVYPDPIKPYSYEYCNYTYVKYYEPNSIQRHLDQSLYVWPIIDHEIEEIRPRESITNTTYLYLYEGQQPKLTNSEFLGYRLKKDFESKDKILVTKTEIQKPKVIAVNDDKINKQITVQKSTPKKPEIVEPLKITVAKNQKIKTNLIVPNSPKAPESKITTNNEHIKGVDNCPGKKSLAYRKKSDISSDSEEQKAYSWLALYYSYLCECESGSQGSDQLVAVINNVVDSYMSNTKGKYGKIPKITKCKTPVEK